MHRTLDGVRSDSAAVMALLQSGTRDSATFKQLVIAIEGTDGVVYVRPGKCPGYRIKGCLLHMMSATPQFRYLWIALDLAGPPIDLMATIAHELRHALEILSDGSIRTGRGIFSFYHPDGNPATRTVETAAALATGASVPLVSSRYRRRSTPGCASGDASIELDPAGIPGRRQGPDRHEPPDARVVDMYTSAHPAASEEGQPFI